MLTLTGVLSFCAVYTQDSGTKGLLYGHVLAHKTFHVNQAGALVPDLDIEASEDHYTFSFKQKN